MENLSLKERKTTFLHGAWDCLAAILKIMGFYRSTFLIVVVTA